MSKQIEIVKKGHKVERFTEENMVELRKCIADPIYFIENYVLIQHPINGRVPCVLYDYQRELVSTFHNYNKCIALLARQMGKTTCAAGFLLWKAMFEPDVTILVVANKMVQAMEIMDRIRFAYENMEEHNWLRAGAVEYNKQSIKFDNGSEIIARATTADAGRGLSISLLYCLKEDTTVTIRDKNTLEVQTIPLVNLAELLVKQLTDDEYMLLSS
jgi:phage terminase large subunit-like protein